MQDKLWQLPPYITCSNCDNAIVINEDAFNNYFKVGKVRCNKCNSTINLWTSLKCVVNENFMENYAFQAIGARSTIFSIILEKDKRYILNFPDHDIPEQAKILYINYTPGIGNLFPVEWHGNVPRRHLIGSKIVLAPVQNGISADKDSLTTKVNVFVTWIESDDDIFQNIVFAFESYVYKQYSHAIVPANASVEAKLSKLLFDYISESVSKERCEDFLAKGATYSYQLNVLLPLIVKINKLPTLNADITSCLNRLRKLRNQIAHQGKLDDEIDQNTISSLLTAVIFGFRYIDFIRGKLVEQ